MVVPLLDSCDRRRVVYLVESPFSQRDSERFGVNELISRGFLPEVWNVGPVYLPGAQRQYVKRATDLACWDITSLEDLGTRVKSLDSDDVVISLVGSQPGQVRKYRRMHQILSQGACQRGVLAAAPVIAVESKTHFSSIQGRLKKSVYTRVGKNNNVIARSMLAVYRQLLRVSCMDFAWVATDASSIDPTLMNHRTQTVLIHSLDYDLVLKEGQTPDREIGPPLLIDDMGPDHPDFISLDEAEVGNLDTQEYFRRLRLVLDSLEQHLGTSIEIAAHPRAQPGSAESRYGGRKVYYGETAKRIRSSSLMILTGASTAVGMAVAWSKPVVMIRADGIHAYERARNEALVHLLDLPVWQLDRFVPREDWKQVPRARYRAYMERFVKQAGTQEKPFWTVVANSLSSAVSHN